MHPEEVGRFSAAKNNLMLRGKGRGTFRWARVSQILKFQAKPRKFPTKLYPVIHAYISPYSISGWTA